MAKNIGVDAAKLAGPLVDQLQKLRSGHLTIEQMNWWLSQTKETWEGLVSGELVVIRNSQLVGENILWQNGPHKIVENDNGTVSAWIDCDQIDWSQSNEEALRATGFSQAVNSDVVAKMPKGEKLTGINEFVFCNCGYCMSNHRLSEKFTKNNWVISPFIQIKINELFPELADKYPNGTSWRDSNGEWFYIAFNRWVDGRSVRVGRSDYDWSVGWWFGGLPQVSSEN